MTPQFLWITNEYAWIMHYTRTLFLCVCNLTYSIYRIRIIEFWLVFIFNYDHIRKTSLNTCQFGWRFRSVRWNLVGMFFISIWLFPFMSIAIAWKPWPIRKRERFPSKSISMPWTCSMRRYTIFSIRIRGIRIIRTGCSGCRVTCCQKHHTSN